MLLEQVIGSLSDAGQAYTEEDNSGGRVPVAGGEPELPSSNPETAEIEALESQIEQVTNMAADSTASLDVVEASLSSAFGAVSGAEGRQVATSNLVSGLRLDARQYHAVVEAGGLQVLEAAEQALQQQAALLQSLKEAVVNFQDADAASMEMLSTMLGHTIAYMDVVSALQQDSEGVGACITTGRSGTFIGEFIVSSHGSELVHGSRRSLLVAGGTSSSSGKGTRAKQDFDKWKGGEAAVRAAANALNADSWDALKGHVSGSGFARLPSRLCKATKRRKGAISNLHGGLLMHLERKVSRVLNATTCKTNTPAVLLLMMASHPRMRLRAADEFRWVILGDSCCRRQTYAVAPGMHT